MTDTSKGHSMTRDATLADYRRIAVQIGCKWFTMAELSNACEHLRKSSGSKHYDRVRNAVTQQRSMFERRTISHNTHQYRLNGAAVYQGKEPSHD